MKKLFKTSALIVSLMAAQGCKTSMILSSTPSGASVYYEGEDIGATPEKTGIRTFMWESPKLLYTKKGYKTVRKSVRQEFKVWRLIFFFWPPNLLQLVGPVKHQPTVVMPEAD